MNQTYVDEPPFVSIAEAAKILHLGRRATKHLIDDGRLPAEKIGKIVRIRRRDVLKFRDGS